MCTYGEKQYPRRAVEPTAATPAVTTTASWPEAGTEDAVPPNSDSAGRPTTPITADVRDIRFSFSVSDANGPS